MMAGAVATMLVVFVFIAFVAGMKYAGSHALPVGAVSIQDVGLKTVDGADSVQLVGHDGWAYSFEDGMQLYLLRPGTESAPVT